MKIVFVWAGYRPGKCGVSDFIAGLVEEFARRNIPCEVIDLKDAEDRWKPSDEARRLLQEANPTFVSLHFVCYAFEKRGLVFAKIPYLRETLLGFPLEIMFHELWLGESPNASVKETLVGWLQKKSALRLLRVLQPKVVHTHAAVYVETLKRSGIDAVQLPLFSATAIAKTPERQSWFPAEAQEALDEHFSRDERWIGVFFGSLHPEWEPEPFFSILSAAAAHAGKQVFLITVGRLGKGKGKWIGLANDYRDHFRFINLEEQPSDNVSALMQMADFGVAASPWLLVGKSSTIATMLDHGLPVIVTRDDYVPRQYRRSVEINVAPFHRCDAALYEKLGHAHGRRQSACTTPLVADRFLHSVS